jgi:hypothetical protein
MYSQKNSLKFLGFSYEASKTRVKMSRPRPKPGLVCHIINENPISERFKCTGEFRLSELKRAEGRRCNQNCTIIRKTNKKERSKYIYIFNASLALLLH